MAPPHEPTARAVVGHSRAVVMAARNAPAGLVTKGLVTKGLVTKGLVTKGLVTKGLVASGLVATGLVASGLVTATLAMAPTTAAAEPSLVSAERPAAALRDAKQDARVLRDEAVSLRRDVAALLGDYVDTYADRFTPGELKELTGLQRDADRQLAGVVLAAGRLRTSIDRDRAQVEAARRTAESSWGRARTAAEASFARARAIMEPRLSLLERLRALGDYTDMMARFDSLGEGIRTVGGRR